VQGGGGDGVRFERNWCRVDGEVRTKGEICIKIELNPQKKISLLQHGRRFFVYSSNMAAVTSCEHTL